MLLLLGIAVLTWAVFYVYVYPGDVKPKAGVYRQPGRFYWLKRVAFFIIFHLRSRKRPKKKNSLTTLNIDRGELSSGGDAMKGYGRGDPYDCMERPQPLSDDPFAIDCCYFGATDKDGNNIVCRLARRNDRCAEIWLFLNVPGIGCLQHTRHPDTLVYYTDESVFRAGGLTFEVLESLRRWRISYSGKLRKGLCTDVINKPQEFVDVSFSFVWSAYSQPFSFDTDMLCCMLGDSVARELWDGPFFDRLQRNHQTHYEQWGELRGHLCVDGHEDRNLYLQCVRDHSYGLRDWREFHRYIIHFIYLETGLSIQVGVFSQPNLMSHVKIGYVSYANGDIVSVSDVGLRLWEVGESPKEPPKSYAFSFTADGIEYQVEVECGNATPVWYHHEDRGGKVMEVFSTFKVNSKPGRGIAEFFYRNEDGPSFTPPPYVPMVTQPHSTVVESSQQEMSLFFTDPACQSPSLVGGKGAQLAQLTAMQSELSATVPQGFCLTLKSFDHQLTTNPAIDSKIERIMEHSVHLQKCLPCSCKECVNLILTTDIGPEMKSLIAMSLEQLKGPGYEKCRFAVRSSAAGEDGDEASSAGQLETILGVVGLDQIIGAIKQCWSSAYSLQAVEYRRQHGQPIRTLVGVVIQEMASADTAGVMFTADPISGSSSRIVINANFGLGESVVSGKSDPDTVVVERYPDSIGLDSSDGLHIYSAVIGQKQVQYVENEDGSVEEKASSDSHSSCLSINNDIILRLARLGVELEKRYGSPRDVEWAVVDGDICLLQCRPITVASIETEDDFLHEFDSPMTCDYHWTTTANISEMMPGAVTPLTMSTFMRAIEYSLQVLNHSAGGRKTPTTLPKALPAVCNHLFISLIDISTMFVTTLLVRKDIMEISLLGDVLPELQVTEAEAYYGRLEGFLTKLKNFIGLIRIGSKAGAETAKWKKKIAFYSVGKDVEEAVGLYNCIDVALKDYENVWIWTLINSSRSGNWASILMSVLESNATDWTNDHYGDMALLLSKCQDVLSAEVPRELENIAREISSIEPSIEEEFLGTPDEKCLDIIEANLSVLLLVDSFLERHGHRCLRESELREKSWRSAPEKLMPVLKVMVKTKSFDREVKEPLTIPQLLDQLKSKPSSFKRFILKHLLPKAWAAVGARELGKSISIEMSEIFKTAYFRLSKLMHEEGRLPDSDLIYFLTHQEIGTLLATASSKLIIRAQKRRKILLRQEEMAFDKITRGRPSAVCVGEISQKPSVTDSSGCLKGMPVSQGCAQGPARVVLSLDQASVIQAGDILVVKSTDVGWSPYFPLIGGLVTELGGLISHGAVVAREYGIPCVVNVAHATRLLTSGEMLEIDGRQGLVRQLDVGVKTADAETETNAEDDEDSWD